MTPWLDDGDVQLYHGDVIATLRSLPAGIAQTCVTSPPYWGLRDYGTAEWAGGDTGCDHLQPVSYSSSTLGASTGGRSEETHARSIGAQASPYRDACGRCGARRVDSQLGLEATPDCGQRHLYRLRKDLTEDQREYVLRRLADEAGRDV